MKRIALPCVCFSMVLSCIASANERPNILFAFADDWGRYASKYAELDGPGTVNDVFHTPNFDRIANEGVVFRNAFVTAPSCTPCRSSLLSGQYFFRTGRGAILQGAVWDSTIPTYPLLLRGSGYHIGHTYKVWSPGSPADAPYGAKDYAFTARGRAFNRFSQFVSAPVANGTDMEESKNKLLGEVVGNFQDFLSKRPEGAPFCYWFGPTNVHRKWVAGSGKKLWGIDPDQLKGKMPSFLPDVPVVRQDFADYLGEVVAFDAALGELIKHLEARGELDNTIVVVSGDHGAPGFPRGKCNLYDFGTAVPLAIRWPKKVPAGRVVDDLVNLMDLAPTFLEFGGVETPEVMTGKSLVSVATSDKSGTVDSARDFVIMGRERHVAAARKGRKPYPQRALRTHDHLYIVNFQPDRWPMGDPKTVTESQSPSRHDLTNDTFIAFADLDASPTKAWLVENRSKESQLFDLAFAKRPREELYVLATDRDQQVNVAGDPEYASIKAELNGRLMRELKRLGDPRLIGDGTHYENPPFAGDN